MVTFLTHCNVINKLKCLLCLSLFIFSFFLHHFLPQHSSPRTSKNEKQYDNKNQTATSAASAIITAVFIIFPKNIPKQKEIIPHNISSIRSKIIFTFSCFSKYNDSISYFYSKINCIR